MAKKILFVIPKNKSLFGDKVNITGYPHVGVAYLVAFLKQQGIQASVYDEGIEHSHSRLLGQIKEFRPDAIGITIFSYCYRFAWELIRTIRSDSNITLIAGGPHVSAVRSEILKDERIDFAVKGEGEYTLLELLKALDDGKRDFAGIRGLIWRKQGEAIENQERPYITDLDKLPFPDYAGCGIERYPSFKHKVLPLITSRGCPFGCDYCSVRLSMGQIFRPRLAENVFAEIDYFYRQGWRTFDFNDDCFSVDKKRAQKICDLIIENKLKIRFQLYNGIRVDTVDRELLKKMKQAGCFFISFGCEAGNERVLKVIKKGITLQQVREALKWANEAGIRNSVNFIIGHATETYQDALDSLRFAASLPTDFVNFYNLLPYPGTESFTWAKQHASFIIPPDDFLENISYRDNSPVFETAEFTRQQRQKVVAMGFALYRKKILTFRLGRFLGNLVYLFTSIGIINKLATRFALTNPLGRFIYSAFARRSVRDKQEVSPPQGA